MDHLTSGDIMTVMYAVVGISLSIWAMLLGMALIFGQRAARAQKCYENSPWKSLFMGVILALVGAGAILLLNSPNPFVKLVAWALLSYLLAIAAVGSGGLALMVGDRIQRMEPGASRFGALARAAAILVITGLVPLFGWFAYAPVVLLVSLGAGCQAIFGRPRRYSEPVGVAEAAQ